MRVMSARRADQEEDSLKLELLPSSLPKGMEEAVLRWEYNQLKSNYTNPYLFLQGRDPNNPEGFLSRALQKIGYPIQVQENIGFNMRRDLEEFLYSRARYIQDWLNVRYPTWES